MRFLFSSVPNILMAGCLIASLFIQAGCDCSSRPRKYQVASSSMFPRLLGPQRIASCSSCQTCIAVAAETFVTSLPTRCYACGGTCQPSEQPISGETIQLLRFSDTDRPERFEVIAFSNAADDPISIKRVWGLPGEQVSIRAGKLWINDQPLRRTLQQFEQLCIPLESFPDPERHVSHWVVQKKGQILDGLTQPSPRSADLELLAGDSVAWNFLRPAPVHPAECEPEFWLVKSEINDDDAENQGLSFQTQCVEDYLLKIDCDSPSGGQLILRCRNMQALIQLEVQVIPATAMVAKLHRVSPAEHDLDAAFRIVCNNQLVLACCDGRVLLRADGVEQSWLSEALVNASTNSTTERHHVELECVTGSIKIRRLAISRDVYVRTTNRDGSGEQRFDVLPRNAYFVMGDNLPASVDSRNGLGFVTRDQMLGKVAVDRR